MSDRAASRSRSPPRKLSEPSRGVVPVLDEICTMYKKALKLKCDVIEVLEKEKCDMQRQIRELQRKLENAHINLKEGGARAERNDHSSERILDMVRSHSSIVFPKSSQ